MKATSGYLNKPTRSEAEAELTRLREAARFVLDSLSDMTTDAFSKGADREARRRLAIALGLDPSDFCL